VDELFQQYASNPAVLLALLFVGPFVLEEAALLGGAALAAAGNLHPAAAAAALFLGMMVSDWALYGLGAWAGRSARIRAWIGPAPIDYGRNMLRRGGFGAGVAARLIPWLLFPVFVASGFVGVGFFHFAAINAVIAFVYTNAIFWAVYQFDILIFDLLDEWAWAAIALLILAVIGAARLAARRFSAVPPPPDRDQTPPG
jgi:membrane protein DedA with SNARE-associated domain